MISLRNIQKTFDNNPVLNNISLEIYQGEILGIIGGSGAGKSTLLRCINLLEKPDSGEIWVHGQNLMRLNAHDLRIARRNIGMVFQNYHLLSQKNILENITIPMRVQGFSDSEMHTIGLELLDIVGLSGKKDAFPEQLSGGQKQRVAIARALSTKPSIVLCDEATAALDPANTNAILSLLLEIQQHYKITLIMITHDMQVAKKTCHRLALMEQGAIVELSAWPNLLKNKTSIIKESLYGDLSQQLPEFIINQLSIEKNNYTILRLLFPGEGATVPFVSKMCRNLNIDINILSAQIDHHQKSQCGTMLISIASNYDVQIKQLITECEHFQIIGEVLGYVEFINH